MARRKKAFFMTPERLEVIRSSLENHQLFHMTQDECDLLDELYAAIRRFIEYPNTGDTPR